MPTDSERGESVATGRPMELCAVVSTHRDRPDECTIYPLSVSSRDARRAMWITARGDSFVELSSFR